MTTPTTSQSIKSKILNNSNEKCGDVSFCIQLGKRVYALNCLFCPQICLQWDIFISHIELDHGKDLTFDSFTHEEIDGTRLKHIHIPVDKDETEEQIKTCALVDTECNEAIECTLCDPLEDENPINMDRSIMIQPMDLITNETVYETNDTPAQSIQDSFSQNEDEILDWMYENNDDISESSSYLTENNYDGNNKILLEKSELIELIIKYYKEHPVLWETNVTEYTNIVKHHDAYKNITKMINKELNLDLKLVDVKGKINKLRNMFRKEHLRVEQFLEIGAHEEMQSAELAQTTSWLYEKMSFLKDHINNRRKRRKRGTKALTNDKRYLPLAKFSVDENKKFIELYKSYPCLWDINHIGFRFKNQRQESLQQLLAAVNEQMNLNLSLEDLQKKLYYLRYAITQEKHRQFRCENVSTKFNPQCMLYTELLFLKDSVGPFKCEYCKDIFNGPDQYKVHKSSHDGSMPYSCPLCNKGFMKVGNCTVHLRRHTKDYQFDCKECGKKFPTSTDLNVHGRRHTGEKPYFCDICGQSFRTWTYFNSHQRRHEKNPIHKCSICSKGFYEHNKLKQHMKSHMNLRDKACNICSKSFTCTKYLNQHKLTHAEIKKYSCKMCGKKFAQHGGLSNHVKLHCAVINASVYSDISENTE